MKKKQVMTGLIMALTIITAVALAPTQEAMAGTQYINGKVLTTDPQIVTAGSIDSKKISNSTSTSIGNSISVAVPSDIKVGNTVNYGVKINQGSISASELRCTVIAVSETGSKTLVDNKKTSMNKESNGSVVIPEGTKKLVINYFGGWGYRTKSGSSKSGQASQTFQIPVSK